MFISDVYTLMIQMLNAVGSLRSSKLLLVQLWSNSLFTIPACHCTG